MLSKNVVQRDVFNMMLSRKMLTKKISSPLYVLVLRFPCSIKLMGKYDLGRGDMDTRSSSSNGMWRWTSHEDFFQFSAER